MLRLEHRELHNPPDLTEASSRLFDSAELCRCNVDVVTSQGLSFKTSTCPVSVGLKGTMSILRLPDEGLPQDGGSCAPQVILSLTIGTEIPPALPPDEKPAGYEQGTPEAPPKTEGLCRLLERRRAAEFGLELPLNASEAADYIGVSLDTLYRIVSKGGIPAHEGDEGRLFFASELNEWLITQVNPIAGDAAQVSDWPERGSEDEQC